MILTPCKVRYISHLCEQTLYSHLASKVRYISFQHNLQLKIHLSSYP